MSHKKDKVYTVLAIEVDILTTYVAVVISWSTLVIKMSGQTYSSATKL